MTRRKTVSGKGRDERETLSSYKDPESRGLDPSLKRRRVKNKKKVLRSDRFLLRRAYRRDHLRLFLTLDLESLFDFPQWFLTLLHGPLVQFGLVMWLWDRVSLFIHGSHEKNSEQKTGKSSVCRRQDKGKFLTVILEVIKILKYQGVGFCKKSPNLKVTIGNTFEWST